ncbi:MAG: IPT/TIG domain-containing protein [Gemmatimonadota bacterium]|nr:IPT/TIG domain-containing protein [Gemmatimonadota bacterium]
MVPRTLGLSTVDGAPLAARLFVLSDGTPVSADGGSATVQADSTLVARVSVLAGGNGTTSFTVAGVLNAAGDAVFQYTDGTSNTAHVNADGSIDAGLTFSYDGQHTSTSIYHFAHAYNGPPLNPVPRVDSISPAQARAYGVDSTLVLIGSSFMPTTSVMLGSTPLGVSYESAHRITVMIPAINSGPATIVISNPPPGGGTRSLQYNVVLPPPVLTSISPTTVPTGGGGFEVHLHGNYFPPGTVALWNGARRDVGYRGIQDLVLDVPGTDIQDQGTVQIAVQTAGGTSLSLALTVSGTPAQKFGEIDTRFDASALVADPRRPIVYASAGPSEQSYPHSIVAIDPVAGAIVWTLSLPKDIGSIAISDDGQYLYVGERGAPTVLRVALATHTIDMTVTLPISSNQPSALAVIPGHPHTFAVVRACDCSPVTGALAIYDDSVPRPTTAPNGPAALAALDSMSVYGVEPIGGGIFTYTLGPTGVTETARVVTAVSGPYTFIGGRVYATGGAGGFGVYDVTAHTSRTYAAVGRVGILVPTTDGTRFYGIDYYDQQGQQSYARVIDATTGAELGAVPINYGANGSENAFRWGTDGIVFAGRGAIVYVRADFVH